MPRWGWFALAIGAVLFLGATGAIVIIAARTRRGVFDQVKAATVDVLSALRPDLSPDAVARVGEILGAQAVFETGGGRAPAWVQGWNFGNVTAGSRALWSGPVVTGPDTEYDAGGNVRDISQSFRKYASLNDAISDTLVNVLNWAAERREGAAARLYAGDAQGYFLALYRAGYFTLPAPEYIAGVQFYLDEFGA